MADIKEANGTYYENKQNVIKMLIFYKTFQSIIFKKKSLKWNNTNFSVILRET